MKIEPHILPGLFLITPRRFGDDRGFFAETWSRRVLAAAGIDAEFVQDNHSLSRRVGTVRGLHFQSPPWVVWGTILTGLYLYAIGGVLQIFPALGRRD